MTPSPGPSAESFMREAIRLATDGMSRGRGGPFGCVVVRRGEIVGRGCNQVTSEKDPTAHAEVVAIRDACRRLGRFSLEDCELYSSCEPCPMCHAAILWARIPVVLHANTREDAARIGFDDQAIAEELAKPPEMRKLVFTSLLHGEALPAFQAWAELPDKTPY